jgi:hypothetical protein
MDDRGIEIYESEGYYRALKKLKGNTPCRGKKNSELFPFRLQEQKLNLNSAPATCGKKN